MRAFGLLFLACTALAQDTTQPAAPATQPVATISQIMLAVAYPYSDALFYIERNAPKTDKDWTDLQYKALMLAESGNLLMMPGRALDQGDWMKDAKLLVEAGKAAVKATQAKDLNAVLALNDQLVASCTTCHMAYHPRYRRRQANTAPAK